MRGRHISIYGANHYVGPRVHPMRRRYVHNGGRAGDVHGGKCRVRGGNVSIRGANRDVGPDVHAMCRRDIYRIYGAGILYGMVNLRSRIG